MKIKFIKYHPAFAYSVGDVADLLKNDAEFLLKTGHAIPEIKQPETAIANAHTETRKTTKR